MTHAYIVNFFTRKTSQSINKVQVNHSPQIVPTLARTHFCRIAARCVVASCRSLRQPDKRLNPLEKRPHTTWHARISSPTDFPRACDSLGSQMNGPGLIYKERGEEGKKDVRVCVWCGVKGVTGRVKRLPAGQ